MKTLHEISTTRYPYVASVVTEMEDIFKDYRITCRQINKNLKNKILITLQDNVLQLYKQQKAFGILCNRLTFEFKNSDKCNEALIDVMTYIGSVNETIEYTLGALHSIGKMLIGKEWLNLNIDDIRILPYVNDERIDFNILGKVYGKNVVHLLYVVKDNKYALVSSLRAIEPYINEECTLDINTVNIVTLQRTQKYDKPS